MLITCPCLLTNHVQLETAAMDTAGGDAHGTLHTPKQACGLSPEHRQHGTPQCLVRTSDTSLGHACPMSGRGGLLAPRHWEREVTSQGKVMLGRHPLSA